MASTAPTTKTPIAASSAQKYASRPRLKPLGAAGRRLRRWATRSSTLLPVSAAECTVSANIAVEPVTTAAASLATTMPRFASSATTTVRVLPLSDATVASCQPRRAEGADTTAVSEPTEG